ncbi:hypothetical protein BGW38_006363, partial [Lunasporangiospora selenospora]
MYSDPRELLKAFPNFPQPSGFPTASEVRKEARERVKNIFEDWNLLNHIIQRNEATIQKRWLKKSRDQRRNTLLHAWPNMPKMHRPEMDALFKEGSAPTTNPGVYLWPNINQEDLLKPKIMLIFLNARARQYPSVFAAADHESFRISKTSGKVMPSYLNEYTMMFTGHNTVETYGRLYSWDEHEDAFDWMHTQRGTLGGIGLQILQVQERVYKFLVECCLHILQVTRENAKADDSPIEPQPPTLSISDGPTHTLSDVSAAIPYSVPAKLDLTRLRDLVAARRSAAEDHMWSLREDPGYFANELLEMKEHRQELLPDIYGDQHSLTRPFLSKEFWNRVTGKVILAANGHLEVWDILLSQIDRLITLLGKYEGTFTEKDSLPEELLVTFLDLDFSIHTFMNGPLTGLKNIVPASPPMRNWFVRMPEENPRNIVVTKKPSTSVDTTQKHLLWLFQELFDDKQRHLLGVYPTLEMMERLVQNDPKSRNLFSAQVSEAITDYSLLAECQRHIRLYQPWASAFENDAVGREQKIRNAYIKQTQRMAQVEEAFKSINMSHAEPSDKKFYYPVEKRKTKENTEAMQYAERNLDAIWNALDSTLLKTVNNSRNGIWTCLLSPDRVLERTPDWIEPPSKSPSKGEKGAKAEDLMQRLEIRSESTVEKDEKKQLQKDKIKTRGPAVVNASSSKAPRKGLDVAIDDQSKIDVQPTFKLDKRALKVFSTLFYQPTTSAQPGEILWNDFLHAMVATGFGAEKL